MVRRRKSSRVDGTRGGSTSGNPLSLGGLPRENFEFLALLFAFLMGFYAFGTIFQSRFFAREDISWRVRKPNAKQNRFQIVTIFFFTFFFCIFLRHNVTYVPAGFGKGLLALILGCYGRIQRGDRGSGPPPPFKKHKNRVSKQYWSISPETSQATKPAFIVGPLSARVSLAGR